MSGIGLMMLGSVSNPVTLQYIGFVDGGTPTGSAAIQYTFNAVNIGGPGLIVMGVSGEGTGATSISSITVNAVAATQVAARFEVGDSNVLSAIHRSVVASGTTANIVVTYPNTVNRMRLTIWRITNYTSETPISSNTAGVGSGANGSGLTTTLTTMQTGAGVVGVYTIGDPYLITWSGLTENHDSSIAGSTSGAGSGSSGASTVTINSNNLVITTTHTAAAQALILVAAAWR